MSKSNKLIFHIGAVFMILVWGGSFINTKILLNNGLNPVEIYVSRFIIAYLGLLCISHKKFFSSNIKDEFYLFLGGLTGGSLYFITENTALKLTLVSDVAIIVSIAPLLTALLATSLYKDEKFKLPTIIGSLIALSGVTLVVFNGNVEIGNNIPGDLLAIAAALSWALYCIILKKLYKKYDTIYITRKIFFYGLLSALPFLLTEENGINFKALAIPAVYLNLIYLGVFASMVCFLLWSIIIKEIGAVRASNYLYLGPVISLIASVVFLNETISIAAYFGFVCVISGLIIAEKVNPLAINFLRISSLFKRK